MKLHELRPPRAAARPPPASRPGPRLGAGQDLRAGHQGPERPRRQGRQALVRGRPEPLDGARFPTAGASPTPASRSWPRWSTCATWSPRFQPGTWSTRRSCAQRGLIDRSRPRRPVKLLGDGALTKPLTIEVHRASASARAAVESRRGHPDRPGPGRPQGARHRAAPPATGRSRAAAPAPAEPAATPRLTGAPSRRAPPVSPAAHARVRCIMAWHGAGDEAGASGVWQGQRGRDQENGQ